MRRLSRLLSSCRFSFKSCLFNCALARSLTRLRTRSPCRANSRITLAPLRPVMPVTKTIKRQLEMRSLSGLGFDSQLVVHRDYDHGKRGSAVVAHTWQWTTELIAAEHRILVVRGEDHHVRMPRADSGPEILVRRPHIREANRVPPGQLAFGVCCLNAFRDLIRRFALHPQFASKLVIWHYGSRCSRVETDGRAEFRVINEVTELGRGIRRRHPPTHDHAHETVITFAGDLIPRSRQYLDRGPTRDVRRRRAFSQCNLGVPRHQVFAKRRILRRNRPSQYRHDQDRPYRAWCFACLHRFSSYRFILA